MIGLGGSLVISISFNFLITNSFKLKKNDENNVNNTPKDPLFYFPIVKYLSDFNYHK
jgi:hypothetical protein